MGELTPDDIALSIAHRYACRDLQIRQLAHLLSPRTPSPPSAVVHGLEATGKSAIIRALLPALGVSHAIVDSRICITARQLYEDVVHAVAKAVGEKAYEGSNEEIAKNIGAKCENLSALAVSLSKLLEGRETNMVLVLDGLDKQREAPPTLFAALGRLGELVPNLTTIFILTYPRPRMFSSIGIPHIDFPPYTRDQSIHILLQKPRLIYENGVIADFEDEEGEPYTDSQLHIEDSKWVWQRFLLSVWESLAKAAARDIVSFRRVADKLWRPFVDPIVEMEYGTRDFSKLMVAKRALFQSEACLIDRIVEDTTQEQGMTLQKVSHDLPLYSKYLLCAAYLASYNPARSDATFFMKASASKRKRRGGGGGTPGRRSKHRKISRTLLGPAAFTLERLYAIFHAILIAPVPPTIDIQTQVATLASLRLLIKTSANADVLDPATKWRVNVEWEYARALARSIGLEMADYLADG